MQTSFNGKLTTLKTRFLDYKRYISIPEIHARDRNETLKQMLYKNAEKNSEMSKCYWLSDQSFLVNIQEYQKTMFNRLHLLCTLISGIGINCYKNTQ